MTYPFEKVEKWEKIQTLVEHHKVQIVNKATDICQEEWGLEKEEWRLSGLRDPEWAREQLYTCSKAIETAVGMMQEHVLPHLKALDGSRSHEGSELRRKLRMSLSESEILGRICAKYINRFEGRNIDKNAILREFQSRSLRSGRSELER